MRRAKPALRSCNHPELPAALARFLSSRGVDCKHVLDVGLAGSSDLDIWKYASQNDGIVISKDEDFLYLANTHSVNARLIWVRLGNCRTATLFTAFETIWPKIEEALEAGDRVIEVR